MASDRAALRGGRKPSSQRATFWFAAAVVGALVLWAAPVRSQTGVLEEPDQAQVWRAVMRDTGVPFEAREKLAQLQAVFDEAQVPRELVWLAEVESAFNPSARSHAGAVGLYQLMPQTAKSLGLSVEPTDERLIPEENARAAARYLRHLYRRFGDWSLVLAAYNAGETRIDRLLTEAEANSFEMIAPLLPAETRAYVPKMDSVLRRREQCSLHDLPPSGVRLVTSR
jgi:membrane-bound lytic murein transglycosylase D